MTRKHLFAFVVFAGIFALAVRPAVDPDLGWHLRTGELIVQTHAVPHQDPFSFSVTGAPWIAHEWLSEVLMYGLWRLGGTALLILAFAALITAAFALVYTRCESRPYAAGLLLLWGAIATIPAWGVRPQMFTLLFASAFLWLLERYLRTGRWQLLALLPAIIVVWVNAHAGFAAGIALILLYAAAELRGEADRTRFKHFTLTALACLAVIPLNPNGFRLYAYPFQTVSAPALTGYIEEWLSPDFHQGIYRLFLLFIAFTVIVLARSARRLDRREITLLLFTLAAALVSLRHIAFFVLVAVPILSRRMPEVPSTQHAATRSVLHAAVALAAIAAVSLHAWSVLRNQSRAERAVFPVAAIPVLRSAPGPIYNNYDWGGYLIAQHFPVFVDGRSDLYGDAFLTQTVRTYEARPGWDATLQRYNIRTVLVSPRSPLATVLREHRDWRSVFEDAHSAVFTRVASLAP